MRKKGLIESRRSRDGAGRKPWAECAWDASKPLRFFSPNPNQQKIRSGNSGMTTLIDIRGVQGQGIPTNNMGAANAIRAVGHAVLSTHSSILTGRSPNFQRRHLRRYSSTLGQAEIVTGG